MPRKPRLRRCGASRATPKARLVACIVVLPTLRPALPAGDVPGAHVILGELVLLRDEHEGRAPAFRGRIGSPVTGLGPNNAAQPCRLVRTILQARSRLDLLSQQAVAFDKYFTGMRISGSGRGPTLPTPCTSSRHTDRRRRSRILLRLPTSAAPLCVASRSGSCLRPRQDSGCFAGCCGCCRPFSRGCTARGGQSSNRSYCPPGTPEEGSVSA
jgi:hypothetical protein